MGKHAYLIAANDNFRVLETCLRLLDDPRNDLYLQIDQKTKFTDEDCQRLQGVISKSRLCIYRNMVINWGGYSQIEAVLHLLEKSGGTKYDYVHFFQGSDLPIKTQDQIHGFFDKQKDVQFVNIEKGRQKMAENKCQYRHFLCHNRFFRRNKLMKAFNFGLTAVQKLLGIRKNLDMELFQGSALFSITGECAAYVLSRGDEIKRRFHLALAADEVFLQSILMDSCYREKISGISAESSSNARLIDRTRPEQKNSPHVWRSDEFAYIINQPEEICFARKFDERIDYHIVLKIYDAVKQ